MKILILANYDLGLYQFRRELINELLINHEVYISLPYGEFVDPLIEAGCKFIDTSMDRRSINPYRDLKLLIQYFRIFNKYKPDLVITYTIKPNIYGGFVSRIKKVIYTVNLTGLGTAFEREGLLKKFVTSLYKIGIKEAKVVFFENSYIRDTFINENIVKQKDACLLSGAGVNLEYFSLLPYPHNSCFRFLFMGRIMKEKGINELLQAMKKLKGCKLDVVGPLEEDYSDIFAEYEKEGWLVFHGYQKDVRPFIESSDCFVLPSWHEGMANTNLECAASGRPIITSNIPGCREAVLDTISGFLCEPKSVRSLYEVMQHMTDLPRKIRQEMGLAGRKHMEKEFDKKIIVQETIKKIFE